VRWFHRGQQRRLFRRLCVGAVVTVTVGLFVPPAQAQPQDPASCQDLDIPVTVAGVPLTMYGRLCVPAGATTVQILVPGGTYNSTYWDISYTPETRSFRLAMNKAGYATLAVDRLGTGRSSMPLSATLTATAQALALHDVVTAMRSGSLGPKFDKVVIGGHSIGSAMAMIEAGMFRDVDGVLITGMTHKMNLITVVPVLGNMIPAILDPTLTRGGLDPAYLTTSRGTRFSAFHEPGPKVPEVERHDESTKDVFAVTEAVDTLVLTNVLIPYSRLINVPVMIVTGDDRHYCGPPIGSDCSSAEALLQSEAPFYSPAARLHTFVLHGYGHSINYAPNAPAYHREVVRWLDTTFSG
jgi:pimeloyl-ACP methyl ester carboxylesterase